MFACTLLALCAIARAEDCYFVGLPTGGSAQWEQPSNWSGGSLPGAQDTGWIFDDDALDRSITLETGATTKDLMIGNSGGGVTTLWQTGDMTVSREFFGVGLVLLPVLHYVASSRGEHIQNGGTNNVDELWLADYNSFQAPSSGRYVLNNGILKVDRAYIGNAGLGTFEQNGGMVQTGNMWLSYMIGARSSYTLNAGTLHVTGFEYIGWGAVGTFIQNGGTHVVDGTLSFGQTNGSHSFGTYILNSADARLIADTELIGRHAAGDFIQSAGMHEVKSQCAIGYINVGRYEMSGGRFSVGSELDIGLNGIGTLNQSGGAVTVGASSSNNSVLSLGYIGIGTYILNSSVATLTVWGDEVIGPSGGLFHQSAGNHRVNGDLYISGYFAPIYGSFILEDGSLQVDGAELLGTHYEPNGGGYFPGAFTQTGGTNIAGSQVLLGPKGTYSLSGGTLVTPLLNIAEGGRFDWSGGTLSLESLVLIGQMNLAAGSGRTLAAANVEIERSTGRLDLADNSMIVDYSGEQPGTALEKLRQDLAAGALFTSLNANGRRLALADNALLEKPSFGGVTFPPGDFTQLLVMYTFAGDSNLDGRVDVTDLSALATSWQTTSDWTGGDFDYSGFVDVADLGLLASNWQAGVNSSPAPSLEEALASLGLTSVSIPEPVVGALLSAVVLTRIRRKRLN